MSNGKQEPGDSPRAESPRGAGTELGQSGSGDLLASYSSEQLKPYGCSTAASFPGEGPGHHGVI